MARFLGLGSEKEVTDCLGSNTFKPYFDELYNNWIAIEKQRAAQKGSTRKQGPQLVAVQAAIANGERFGDEKYSGYLIDKSTFTEIDHYALCLFRLRKVNADNRSGLFRNKSLSESEIEVRLWMGMLRATYEKAESKQHHKRSSDMASKSNDNLKEPSATSLVESSRFTPRRTPPNSIQLEKVDRSTNQKKMFLLAITLLIVRSPMTRLRAI
jgi:hypothetical protein